MRSISISAAIRSSESEFRTTDLMARRRRGSTSGEVEFVAFSIKDLAFVPRPLLSSSSIDDQTQSSHKLIKLQRRILFSEKTLNSRMPPASVTDLASVVFPFFSLRFFFSYHLNCLILIFYQNIIKILFKR